MGAGHERASAGPSARRLECAWPTSGPAARVLQKPERRESSQHVGIRPQLVPPASVLQASWTIVAPVPSKSLPPIPGKDLQYFVLFGLCLLLLYITGPLLSPTFATALERYCKLT